MTAAPKKVVVRSLGGAVAWGYLPMVGLVHEGKVDLMQPDGKVKSFDLNEIETICYVRDFNLDDALQPERLVRRSFAGRPREEGLWVRVAFRELEVLEGLVEFGLGLLDGVAEDRGLLLTPPDGRGNTLRVFVPRTAMRGLEVLGLVTAPTKRLAQRAEVQAMLERQAGLFDRE